MTKPDFPSELFIPFIEHEENVPQYLSVFRGIKQAIIQGNLVAGAKLPASRILGSTLKLSRNTIKTAYEMLLAEGYIITKHGSGSFVSNDLPEYLFQDKQPVTTIALESRPPQLSELAKRLQASTTKHSARKSLTLSPFQTCLSSFPWANWQKHVTKAAREMKYSQVSSSRGNALLRSQIADYLSVVRGVKCDAQQVIICSGGQQAIYMTLQLLASKGDEILLENPGYSGITKTVDAIGAQAINVEVDEQGFCIDNAISQAPNARIALVTPSRNHPMGYTLSLQRRIELIHWAKENNAWIIEDDYDSEFRFDGKPIGALQGLDQHERVIYAGTFTRILHSSIRIGYVVVPKSLLDIFTQAKQIMDGGLVELPQIALANFMASGQFASHLRRMRKLYQQRRDTLNQLLQTALPNQLQRVESDGGMHSVFLLPDGYSDVAICQRAEAQGLGIRALSSFYAGTSKQQGLVIGFSGYDTEVMKSAVNILARIYHSMKPQS